MKDKTCVVIGATSFIGSALANQLAEEDNRVFAIYRKNSPNLCRLARHPRIEPIVCDLSELGDLKNKISTKCDILFHLAWAHSREREDIQLQQKNVGYTQDAARVAHELGCTAFLCAGSQAEYGLSNMPLTEFTEERPISAYGCAKLEAYTKSAELCKHLGLRHIWPRILSVYGPKGIESSMLISLIGDLLEGKKPKLTDGSQIWDFLYIDDCVRALCLLAECQSAEGVFVLGSGQAKPLREYIETVRDCINRELPLGLGEIKLSPTSVRYLAADISHLHSITGFKPEMPFLDGITETIKFCRERKGL